MTFEHKVEGVSVKVVQDGRTIITASRLVLLNSDGKPGIRSKRAKK